MPTLDTFIRFHNQLIDSHINQLRSFVENKQIANLCSEFAESRNDKFTLGFNVFTLTSDIYYRENYHSNLICAFLNPQENHHQGNLFLNVLIDMLNHLFSKKVKINRRDYLDAISKREVGNIDILISSDFSKHCIIIENKIHGAGDMPRQLPRYFDSMIDRGFIVDAIIYIPLNPYKQPDTSDWSQRDKNNILPILCHLPAFSKDGRPNLVDNWIVPCSLLTNDIDCHSILRQYGCLIKSLNINTMDKIIISKFYKTLLEGNNLESALSIKAMLDDVPVVMALNLYDRLTSETTFGNVWNGYKPNFCGVIFQVGGREYKIDTYSSLHGYEIYLFPNEEDRTNDVPWTETLDSVNNTRRLTTGEFLFKFPFKSEDAVVLFIKELLKAADTFDKKCQN